MLNKSNITWNAKQVTKMMSKGLLQFNNVVQRSYVWEKTRKSDFIHSMIEGWPTTAFFAPICYNSDIRQKQAVIALYTRRD